MSLAAERVPWGGDGDLPVFPLYPRGIEGDLVKPYAPHLKPIARKLRSGMTDAEQLLWSRLRRKQVCGVQFNRQKPLGPYIVDFYCASARLVIEVDGGQHFSDEGKAGDEVRDRALEAMKLRTLRFDNGEVMRNIEGVMAVIEQVVLEAKSSLPPLSQRGGEGEVALHGGEDGVVPLQRQGEKP